MLLSHLINQNYKTSSFCMKRSRLPLVTLICLSWVCLGATVKDREAAVRNDRASLQNDAQWIYHDFQRGFVEAKRTGKPLLVVLRCVPCLACAGIDAAVLLEGTELAPLLKQFVCVRITDANALDLTLFQFDYDLSFSTVFFNGDGTVYGRYGSWKHQKDSQDQTTAGYKRALEAVLAIHRAYPGNQQLLAGKQGRPISFKTPIEIPALGSKYKSELDWDGKVVPSCIHCHQIGDALRLDARTKTQALTPQSIYPWPAPETIGMTLSSEEIATIQNIAAGSIAARAGLKAGDELLSLDSQPLASIADVSWVLHHAPEEGKLRVGLKSAGRSKEVELKLAAGWRSKTDMSRRASAWNLRGMATGGLVLEDLADAERKNYALNSRQMALLVKLVGQYGKHAAAKQAGFKKDDVLLELDGNSNRMSESELLGFVLQKHQAGDEVKAVVLREKQRVQLALPIQ
jgi:serine protease Do